LWRVLFVLTMTCGAAASAEAAPFQVDAVHSTVLFRIKHMLTSNSWGRFNAISGTVDLDSPNPSLDIELKADSVDTADAKRDEHLRGPDFFNVKQFPTIRFKSTKITKTGDNQLEAEGKLTLHGVEKPVTVKLERGGPNPSPFGGKVVGIDTSFTIKRSEYGMKYMLGPIGDEVLLYVSLEAAAK
jgi:polyisoprenoid-binding protein YceI